MSAATQGAARSQRYGPASPAARAGHQRYFINRTLALQYLLLNSRRAAVRDARGCAGRSTSPWTAARSPRPPGQGFSGLPTDQYLPTGMPGFRDADIYPLGASRTSHAPGASPAAHRRHAVMYTCNQPACLRGAEIVRANLGAIGIAVEIKQFSILQLFRREYTPGEPFDIGWCGWSVDYPDPSDFLDIALAGPVYDAHLNRDASRNRRQLARLSRLSGEERLRAYGSLDIELARHAAPLATFANLTADDFFSARIGCQVFQPIYGMDLGALCRRG